MTEGELCSDEARTAENGPTEAQWPDEGRPEVKDLIHHSTEAPILLHFHRTPGSLGKCRLKRFRQLSPGDKLNVVENRAFMGPEPNNHVVPMPMPLVDKLTYIFTATICGGFLAGPLVGYVLWH